MHIHLSDKFKLAALSAVSLVAYGYTAANILSFGGNPSLAMPVALAHIEVKTPLAVEAFKAEVDRYSKNNMMVVVLRRNECAVCPEIPGALEEARERLIRKIDRGFTVYELNAEQNPEIAKLFRQREPLAPARLHVFYNSEKIYESHGISTNPRDYFESLEMVQALADGEVSIYNKYQPSHIFTSPVP